MKKETKKETKKEKKLRIQKILGVFESEYGRELSCALTHKNAFELLVATILSAQCTDKRVNEVTPGLFEKYRDPAAFAAADRKELEKDIFSTGFYRMKAEHIIASARMIEEEYEGKVPSDMENLLRLPGVGRKTANVILGHIFSVPSIVVDTHVKRISRLLCITDTSDPEKAEYELMELLPKKDWTLWNMYLITLGRTECTAKRPRCDECFLSELCPHSMRK